MRTRAIETMMLREKAWRVRLLAALIGISAVQAFPADAEEVPASRRWPSEAFRGQLQPLPECTCRAKGRFYAMGAELCLQTPSGAALFRCEMAINAPNWRQTRNLCPEG